MGHWRFPRRWREFDYDYEHEHEIRREVQEGVALIGQGTHDQHREARRRFRE